MIVVLDPALFLTEGSEGPLGDREEKEIEALIDNAARICRDRRAVIPGVDFYWNKLQREMVGLLRRRTGSQRLRSGLDNLRQYAKTMSLAWRPTTGKTRMWGVKPLFAWNGLRPDWLEVMERLLVGCVQQDDETVLITRLFSGRNMMHHAVGGSTLREKTWWRVCLHVHGHPPCRIPCVRNPRNLLVPWTARFDEKLPDEGRFPFCPPPKWWSFRTKGWGTHTSKPAWIDVHGSGWAQPATGGDNHWDVFLRDPNLIEAVGLNAINVVAWGTREAGKIPGENHHVPKGKEGRFKAGSSWTCPK